MGSKPIVGIITNEIINFNGRQISHSTGKRYVKSVMEFADVVPVLIPSSISSDDLDEILENIHEYFPKFHLNHLMKYLKVLTQEQHLQIPLQI